MRDKAVLLLGASTIGLAVLCFVSLRTNTLVQVTTNGHQAAVMKIWDGRVGFALLRHDSEADIRLLTVLTVENWLESSLLLPPPFLARITPAPSLFCFRRDASLFCPLLISFPLWVVIVAFGVYPVAVVTGRRVRARRRRLQGQCANCGYDLTGLPHRRCPECGGMDPGAAQED